MEKRIFMLVLVVALGILMGVGIVSRQTKNSALETIIQQQSRILQSQKYIEKKFREKETGHPMLAEILQKQKALEERVAALEKQIKLREGRAPQRQRAAMLIGPEKYDIPIEHSPVYGDKNAPVTIVEFMDFQCPFCARFHGPMFEALKAYPGQVNYVLKNFPLSFHAQAKPAAKAALAAAEQGKYWEMVKALLENGRALSAQKFEEIAQDIGLDVQRFRKDLKEKDAQWEAYIRQDMALGAKIGVRGTPTFFINGRKVMARDVASWKKAIETALKETKEK